MTKYYTIFFNLTEENEGETVKTYYVVISRSPALRGAMQGEEMSTIRPLFLLQRLIRCAAEPDWGKNKKTEYFNRNLTGPTLTKLHRAEILLT